MLDDMTTARTGHYSDLSAEYLRKAQAHLAEGDLTQASEKGWGAAAVAVKAVAEARGLRHEGHRELWRALEQFADETGDGELRAQFGLAGALHTNFYEAWLGVETVEDYLGHVERLVGKLGALV